MTSTTSTDFEAIDEKLTKRKTKLWRILFVAVSLGIIITLAVLLATKSTNLEANLSGTPSIIFLGDSNTEYASKPEVLGFQTLFNRDYVRKADVLNRGCSGWTTRTWRDVFPKLISELRARSILFTVIILGTNDANLANGTNSISHVPLDEYKSNLKLFINELVAIGHGKILLGTPIPFDDTSSLNKTRTNAVMQVYGDAMKNIGMEFNVPVVDLWTSLQVNSSGILYDGIHLNREGNLAIYNLIKRKINQEFPQFTPQTLPNIFN